MLLADAPTISLPSILLGMFGGICGLVGVGFAYWRGKVDKKRAVTYDWTAAELFDSKAKALGELKITFNKQDIGAASVVSVTIWNSGREDILQTDFAEPLQVKFTGSEQILAGRVTETKPAGPKMKEFKIPEGNPTTLSMVPTLLNRGQQFSMLVLVSGFKGNVDVSGAIRGAKIEKRSNKNVGTTFASRALQVLLRSIGHFSGL